MTQRYIVAGPFTDYSTAAIALETYINSGRVVHIQVMHSLDGRYWYEIVDGPDEYSH